MTTQKDIANEISREMMVEFLKQGIRATYPPQIAEIYCKQVDDAKHLAKLMEKVDVKRAESWKLKIRK